MKDGDNGILGSSTEYSIRQPRLGTIWQKSLFVTSSVHQVMVSNIFEHHKTVTTHDVSLMDGLTAHRI
jgi:hypothetical protein